jgi:hypothetical protein
MAPHSTLLSFYTFHLELFSLYVLRVLGKQTLETSKEVKDPYVPCPSLAKEVKDSSLTILFSHRSISTVKEEDRAQF